MSKDKEAIPAATQELLAEVDLHYVQASEPGCHRRRAGRGFVYLDPEGQVVRDATQRARFKALAIPPAWRDVWIAADPNAHLRATGRDETGRKQYLYHPAWERVREQTKYTRLLEFGQALPHLRSQVDQDLRSRKLSQTKVLALVVRLLETTLIRIGNPEYERQNGSYGLTTLLDEHVTVEDGEIVFEFRGKSGVEHEIVLDDPRLARLVKACQELPGQRLFQYMDDEGAVHAIDSGMVNDYLRSVTGSNFTAKEFRTWGGTVQALHLLRGQPRGESEADRKRQVVAMIKEVAACLGNTPAVCRQHYIHPCVTEAFLADELERYDARTNDPQGSTTPGLSVEEQIVLALLHDYLQRG
ncbi:MAG TPA: DNA topoisomerase IB [Caldilineaceae bacterium]|nr:DNA topoisomerase IB [Caldilineaceae bacterium]